MNIVSIFKIKKCIKLLVQRLNLRIPIGQSFNVAILRQGIKQIVLG